MSKIDIVLSDVPDTVRAVEVLRAIAPETSIAEYRKRITSGSPVIERILFENDHDDVAAQLRALLSELPKTGARIRVFELRVHEKFKPDANLSAWEISPSTLLNILATAGIGPER